MANTNQKNPRHHLTFLLGVSALLLALTASAASKRYQITGPVLEVTDTYVVVQKGDEKWQVARDKGTKINGDLKVGAKVTVEYEMTATSIEVKDAGKADAKPDGKGKAKGKKN